MTIQQDSAQAHSPNGERFGVPSSDVYRQVARITADTAVQILVLLRTERDVQRIAEKFGLQPASVCSIAKAVQVVEAVTPQRGEFHG